MNEPTISPNGTTQTGTPIGIGGMPISSTIASLFLTMVSGLGSLTDSTRGTTIRTSPMTITRTIITPVITPTLSPTTYYCNEGGYSDEPMVDQTVTTVQTELTQLGYYNGPIDGIFGPSTRDAVANYQIAKQLNVTGSLSPDTLQSLGLPQAPAS
jgi:peptidoglycan hydrolase-like protein with peptidoglycan-binding domain